VLQGDAFTDVTSFIDIGVYILSHTEAFYQIVSDLPLLG
jgi:hypothetical protein